MEILTSCKVLENGNACSSLAPRPWLHSCVSLASAPPLDNLLILWNPVTLKIAHACFQEILLYGTVPLSVSHMSSTRLELYLTFAFPIHLPMHIE